MERLNRRLAVILGGAILLVLIVMDRRSTIVDVLWFEELGYEDVYWTAFWARLWVRLAAGSAIFLFFFVNLRLAASSFGSIRRRISNIEIHEIRAGG